MIRTEDEAVASNGLAGVDAGLIQNIGALVPAAMHPAVLEALNQDAKFRSKHNTATLADTWRYGSAYARLKALAMICFLYVCVLPIFVVAACIVRMLQLKYKTPASAQNTYHRQTLGTALVSGGNKTKALHVCRHLAAAGWRVVLVDGVKNWSCCSRFSNSVSKFYSVPVPNERPLEYLKAMSRIGAREKVSLFVPVSIAQYSIYEALAAEVLPTGCHSCSLPAAEVAILNDKIKFHDWAVQRSLSTPSVFPITSHDDLRRLNNEPSVFKGQPYLLKSVHYAALNRADMFKLPCSPQILEDYIEDLTISETQPWLLQQFIVGPEYASYSILYQGRIVAHADNVAELSCLNYEHIGDPDILKWVEKFAAADPRVSGQICFDFMRNDSDNTLYCIECNPRTSTNIVSFHGDDRLAAAFSQPESVIASGAAPLQPNKDSRHMYWLMNEAGKLVSSDWANASSLLAAYKAAQQRIRFMAQGSDAVADNRDLMPFFALHFLQIPVQLFRIILAGTPWSKVDWCSGKVVCLDGD